MDEVSKVTLWEMIEIELSPDRKIQKSVTISTEITHEIPMNDCLPSEARFDQRTIEIPVFLFFTWARSIRSDCGKQFIRFNKTLRFTLV